MASEGLVGVLTVTETVSVPAGLPALTNPLERTMNDCAAWLPKLTAVTWLAELPTLRGTLVPPAGGPPAGNTEERPGQVMTWVAVAEPCSGASAGIFATYVPELGGVSTRGTVMVSIWPVDMLVARITRKPYPVLQLVSV